MDGLLPFVRALGSESRRLAESQLGLRGKAKNLVARTPFTAPLAFGYSYFVRLGFLDGRAGFHYAIAKAFYYWQIGVKEREIARRSPSTSDVT